MRALVVVGLVVVVSGCLQQPLPAAAPARELQPGHKPYVKPQPLMLEIPTEQARVSHGVQKMHGPEHQMQALFNGAPLPIYLERNQVTYTGGADDSSQHISSVVGSGSATVSAWPGDLTSWNQTVQCVKQQFSRFDVTVTDVKPSGGEYIEAHMGGTPDEVGLPQGVGGVAPIDSFSCNVIPQAVVYIFSGVLGGDPEENCEVAAQEIAHAFSLDHEFLCQDPMTYLSGCGNKTFQDQAVSCGEFSPRQCNCNKPNQDSVQQLTEKAGAASGTVTPPNPSDATPPTAALTSPANGATLQGNTTITVSANVADNVTLSDVELVWNFTGDNFPCPGTSSGGAASCTLTGGTATWTINVGQGDRTFSVRATDENNNVTTTPDRTIHLTADGNPATPPAPGSDTTAPAVTMLSPDDGATLLANSTIQVTAQATDDSGSLADVELLWTFSGDSFPCPLQQQNVQCAVTGNTYTWSLNVGVGSRAFQVKATDLSGNSSTTPERTITLSTDATPPTNPPPGGTGTDVAEPNNSAQQAFATRCGTALDVIATPGDDDWYTVEAPAGVDVQAGVSAAAGSSLHETIFGADGTTVLENSPDAVGAGSLTATSTGSNVLVKVTTSSASAVAYRLTVTCGSGQTQPPPASDDNLEPNNSIQQATRSFCGQERDNLAALDDDFFVVEVRDNDTLHVVVRSDGADASILDKSGTELGSSGTDVSASSLPGGDVLVKVSPTGPGASYDVKFNCTATIAPTPSTGVHSGCSSTTADGTALGALMLAGLGALGFARRRR